MRMVADIYWPQGSTQVPATPKKRTKKGRSRKGNLPRIWKGRQVLQPSQQSNARREARKRLRKIKRNLTRRPITKWKNGYPMLIRKENKMKRAVKSHRSVKKRKQRNQRQRQQDMPQEWSKEEHHSEKEILSGVLKTKSTINKTQTCRKRINIMTSLT